MAKKGGLLEGLASRGLFMRLLMFSMLGMGCITGGLFPLFTMIVLGLPEEIVFRWGFVLGLSDGRVFGRSLQLSLGTAVAGRGLEKTGRFGRAACPG